MCGAAASCSTPWGWRFQLGAFDCSAWRNDVTAVRYGAHGLQAPPMPGMPSTRYSETGYHVLSLHLPADRPIDCAPHALGRCRHVEVVDAQRTPERINDSIHHRRT